MRHWDRKEGKPWQLKINFTADILIELVSYEHSWVSLMVLWGLELKAEQTIPWLLPKKRESKQSRLG